MSSKFSKGGKFGKRHNKNMHILGDDDHDENEDGSEDEDDDDERVEMDSSGSHCLKLESFIARRRARENAGSQNSIIVVDDNGNDVSAMTMDIRLKSGSSPGRVGRSGAF